jgi:hypothetical protein
MAQLKLCRVEELPPGSIAELRLDKKRTQFAMLRVRSTPFMGTVPMLGVRWRRGDSRADGGLPGHAWEFDCRTGALDRNPEVRLETFPVRIRDSAVILELN